MDPGKSIVDLICEPVKQMTLIYVNGKVPTNQWFQIEKWVSRPVAEHCETCTTPIISELKKTVPFNTRYRSRYDCYWSLRRVDRTKVSFMKMHKKKYNY